MRPENSEFIIKKITKVKKEYVVLTEVDEFKVCEDVFIRNMLLVGRTITSKEIENIQHENDVYKFLNLALNFLSYQLRTRSEIRAYLQKKAAPGEIINEVLDKLATLNYLDDEKYASELLQSYYKKNKGPMTIKEKLLQKGIHTEVIEKTLLGYTLAMQKEIMEKISAKKMASWANSPKIMIEHKLKKVLASEGFNSVLINEVLSEIDIVDNTAQCLLKDLEKVSKMIDSRYPHLDERNRKVKIINRLLAKGYRFEQINAEINYLC